MQSFQNLLVWILILAALFAANIFFFVSDKAFISSLKTRPSVQRWLGWALGYALVLALGMWFERYLGQNADQGWQFWVVTTFVYAAFSFPGFVYRYLGLASR